MNIVQQIPQGYFARNIEPLGYHDLNGKPAFKFAMPEVRDVEIPATVHFLHRQFKCRLAV